VWADIEREAEDASDAYLVVEDDCRFWSEATSESSGAQPPKTVHDSQPMIRCPRLQDHLAKVPKNWDLICFSGEDLLGAPETDPWLPGLHRSAVIAGTGGMAPHGLSPGAVAV